MTDDGDDDFDIRSIMGDKIRMIVPFFVYHVKVNTVYVDTGVIYMSMRPF